MADALGSKAIRSKSVVITGCSSGFGRLMVSKFLDGGWQVFATSRTAESLQNLSAPNLHVLPLNVTVAGDREKLVQAIREACPAGLDCLINNAGYALVSPLESLTEEQIRQQIEVNFFAPTLLIRDLLPELRLARGRVINVSSVVGFTGLSLHSVYAASKHALEGLVESLSYELAGHEVQMCLVEPGVFPTQFASHIEWSKSGIAGDDALYAQQQDGFKKYWQRAPIKEKGKDPRQVSDAAFALANMKRMPLRVRVGSDSQALYYLRRFLPQRIADRALQIVSSKLL